MKTKTMKTTLALAATIAIVSVGCKTDKQPADETPRGINLAYMDTTVSPTEDFFRYVNGTWLDANPIPEDETSWGSFAVLRKKNEL